jgi:Ca2+-binding RTX toxin-like protein
LSPPQSDGTNDAYDGGLNLNGFPFLGTAETEDNGREIVIGSANIGSVEVTRKIYVPEDQSWARFLEIVTNTSSSTVNYTVQLNTNLGSDSSTVLVSTSSGDTIFNTEDNWLVTDDFDGGGDPTMVHVFAGEGEFQPDTASLSFDNLNFAYNLTLAPGETQIVMHFAAQNADQATALTKATQLAQLELEALEGMSDEELQQVVNFSIAPPLELIGTEGDDVLTGSGGGDFISGLGGNDILQGLGGNDQIFGGSGDDLIIAGDGNDTVAGDQGHDSILGGNGNDLINGGSGNDRILGESGDDTLNGDEGRDSILGGNGNDLINGGSGNDRILGESGDDTLNGDSGNDIIDGGQGNDTISGGTGNDRLIGGSEDDILNGDAGADTLTGGLGNDALNGGTGNDRLIGVETSNPAPGLGFGAGEVDTLAGGTGRDTFVLGDATSVFYDDGDPLSTGEADYALISDFNPTQDFIQLQGSAQFYSLDFFTSPSGTIDAALIYDPGVSARGEVIAILQNVSPQLSITNPAFIFEAPSIPANPQTVNISNNPDSNNSAVLADTSGGNTISTPNSLANNLLASLNSLVEGKDFVAGELIVKFKPGVDSA